MKKIIFGTAMMIGIFTATAFAQGPPADLVQRGVDAYNNHDVAYFEKNLAADAIWLDEDGHVISGKNSVLGFIRRQITAASPRKLTVSNIRMGNTTDAAWATFAYTVAAEGQEKKGLNTTVFKKVGNDWQIVLVHGAVNAPGHN